MIEELLLALVPLFVVVDPFASIGLYLGLTQRHSGVIDQKSEEPIWTLFEEGVRPMAFETNPDGSTKRIFVQLSNLHGFAVVDFAQRKEVARIELPNDIPAEKVDQWPFNASPSHFFGVALGGRTLWVTSRPNARV